MGILADRLNTMAVKVMSPDATVRLYLTGGGQLLIEFARGSLAQHTEASVSTQLSHVCTRALRRQQQDMSRIVHETIAEVDVDEDDAFAASEGISSYAPTPGAKQLEADTAKITALGRSPRSAVTARRIPGQIMEVKLRKGTLQRWSADEVTVEIYAALDAVAADHRSQAEEIRQEIFRTAHSPNEGQRQ